MKKNISYILTIAIVGLCLSCGPSGNHFKIEGHFTDMQEGELYIYNMSNSNARFDTLRVKGGSFVYDGTADEPTPYLLVFPNAMEQVIFVDAGKTLEYEASTTDLKNYTVKGSDENKLLNEFRDQTKKMTAIKTKSAARTFIEGHPASPVSIYMLDRYFVQDENIVNDEIMQLVNILLKQHPNNVYLIDLQTNLKMADNTAVGKTIPKLTLNAKGKGNVDLSSSDKPFTLIAFWSTWMDEQWDFMPKIRNYGRNYSEQLRVIAVSLDTQMYQWEETIGEDSVLVNHVCDGRGWDSQPVVKLGVRFVPYYVLVNHMGRVLANGTTIDGMDQDVNKFVKKNVAPVSPTDSLSPAGGPHFAGREADDAPLRVGDMFGK